MISILIISGIAFAVFLLIGESSQEKMEYEAQIKQQMQGFTDELISELDQIDTSEVPAEIITDAGAQATAEELAKMEEVRKQEVLQLLSVSYSKALNDQKLKAMGMVSDLIEQGKADWTALAEKGENTAANKAKLASEYFAKSKVMEAQMDAGFSALMEKMEEQLRAQGIDPVHIIEGYQAEYRKIKEQNKNKLMEKALAAMKQ